MKENPPWILIILAVIVLSSIFIFISKDEQPTTVKCYDAKHNEILGERCIQEPAPPEDWIFLAAVIVTVFIAGYAISLGALE